ncbi:three-helix bundle dimerization domain-containing protein [Microbacterium sp. NPDC058062]|uniref:three-helix bundle dimerization domain-containing protein n=1 Tax=Microbacterium sp. NPDC058062 TaxID=3346320 RepID=UPI0036DAECFC
MTRELADEDQALSDVVDRLEERFPSRDRSEIERAVAEARSHFERAKVRDFVPVLVEREARARLEHPIQ